MAALQKQAWSISEIIVDRVAVEADRVAVVAHVRTAKAPCPPLCRRPSFRAHSRYSRHLGDLPWQGRVGELHLQGRRFRCATADCPRCIFAERLSTVAAPRVRRIHRLAKAQRAIALSAGGNPDARLSTRLAMPVSGDTLLRLIRAVPVEPALTPRVIGIDDWAWLHGKCYGTLVVDIERNRPIDLLPGRHRRRVVQGAPRRGDCRPGPTPTAFAKPRGLARYEEVASLNARAPQT